LPVCVDINNVILLTRRKYWHFSAADIFLRSQPWCALCITMRYKCTW